MLRSCILAGAACASAATPNLLKRAPDNVPSFVVDYAPIVYLHKQDSYLPSDIGNQLSNTEPRANFTPIQNAPNPLTLANLADLNNLGGKDVYLTSKVRPNKRPEYFRGVVPNNDGKTEGAVSATVIVNDHGDKTVDAFYFYFYAFDFGGNYLGQDVGDHVGDWEHNMIRFVDDKPSKVWFSQHSAGQAFEYGVLDKYEGGLRPITYSANGSHAMYATKGDHGYGIPGFNFPEGIVEDHTEKGVRWDPILSAYYYSYDKATKAFTAYNPEDPVSWLSFTGHWGDEEYPEDDPIQECLWFGELCIYAGGPTGPADKQLERKKVCPDSMKNCYVWDRLVQ